ncbi:YbjN domain-containing protein [Actinomycetospora endophytica]|uniref:YbjN domain-containing protein n=1 Tax=Actinomycetospora endophytica TaxID=2291215 RepID=A0ABS8P575_9PSEU|nr:YbjN domain-containing protein [Actinomycetospora endophytica]MCD2193386.1 YbjN domain-containing protein [Actinomycetospora endophytica]
MASWDDLVLWVRVRYEVMAQDADGLTFRLPTTEGRDQLVYVRHRREIDGQDWMQIESPIARLDDIDARQLLELAESTVVGGAAAVDGTAVFRHAAPLSDLTFAEFEAPFRLVTKTADDLERRLTGADRY